MPNFVPESLFVKPRNSTSDLKEIKSLVHRVLQDPLKQQQLCDRVYQLMQEDLVQQQRRHRGYGGKY